MTKLLAKQRLASHKVTAADQPKPPKWLPAVQKCLTGIFTGGSVKLTSVREGESEGLICWFECKNSDVSDGPSSLRLADYDGDSTIVGFANLAKLCKQKQLGCEFTSRGGSKGFHVEVGDLYALYE